MTTIDGLKSSMEYLVPFLISLLFIKLNSIITMIFSILWSHCKSIMNQMNNIPRINSLILSATGQAMVRMCMNSIFGTPNIRRNQSHQTSGSSSFPFSSPRLIVRVICMQSFKAFVNCLFEVGIVQCTIALQANILHSIGICDNKLVFVRI